MKTIILVMSLFLSAQSFAQDSTKLKMKEWLGVLTLTGKYTEEKTGQLPNNQLLANIFSGWLK